MARSSLIATILTLAAVPASAQINIADYGAVPNDGVDDQFAIQTALNAVPAEGASVYVPPGTYDLSDTIKLKSRTELFGSGPASVLRFHGVSGGGGTTGPAGIAVSAPNNSDMQVLDLAIDTTTILSNNRCVAFYLSSRTRIERVHCLTSSQAFHHVRASDYWVVNNYVRTSATIGDGMIGQWWGSHNRHVVGNTIDGTGLARYGICVSGTDTSVTQATPCYNIEIRGNLIRNVSNAGVYLQGHIGGVRNIVVESNVVDTIGLFHGILLDDKVSGSVVANNVVANTAKNGIRLRRAVTSTGPNNNTIASNIVRNANTSGATGDAGAAIALGFAGSATNNSIIGNRVLGSTHTNGINLCAGCDSNIVSLNGVTTGTGMKIMDAGNNNHILNNW